MKKKNILYNILSFILIIFALLYIIPMYQSITQSEYGLFDVYEGLSIIMISIILIAFFVINLVIGILNIKKKNNAIGVLNIILGCIALVNIALTIIYNETYDDVWGYIIFSSLICQIVISIVNLILNRKKESSNLKKHSIIIFCIISFVSTVLVVFPRILLTENKDRLIEAYNVLKEQNRPQIFIDYDSNFYDTTGNLIAKNNYKVMNAKKIDEAGTYIITVMDDNNELWIVNYTGEKLVRLYYIFSDSYYLLNNLISVSNIYNKRYNYSEIENRINYLTAKNVEGNYLKFTDDNKEISIEIEIDKTQIANDTSFLELLENYYMEHYDYPPNEISGIKGIDLETIYKYKKNYYLTYKNNERVKLECNNLLIDYSEEDGNYILFMYNNWNIPFYDEQESGFYDLEGKKYTINKQYLIYNTFDKYFILYNKLSDYYYISTYGSNDRKRVESLIDCTENYVYADKKLYLISNDKIEEVIERTEYTINIGNDKSYYSNIGSVYDYYVIK